MPQRVVAQSIAREGERYRHVLTWYGRPRGRTTVDAVIDVVTRAAGDAGGAAA